MQIHSVGIDLGKTTFHLVALGAAGKVLVKKKFTQRQLLTFTANLQTSLIGLEACAGAHFLGRALQKQGHDVRLIPAQFVKPFVKSNKNDFVDAEAIAEAVERKNMRFVPIKTDDQLDLQAIHRVRDRLISRRTAVINQLRAFLLERGMVFAQTPAKLKATMASTATTFTDLNLPTEVCTGTATTKEQSQRRAFNLIPILVFHDRPTYKDRHAAELIVARRDDLHSKAEYIAADLSIARSFSLAVLRRTIQYRY